MDIVAAALDAEVEEAAREKFVAVSVLTERGLFPNDWDFRRVGVDEVVDTILKETAKKQELLNTADWIVHAHGRQVDPSITYQAADLHGVVEIRWHKDHGGGGAREFG